MEMEKYQLSGWAARLIELSNNTKAIREFLMWQMLDDQMNKFIKIEKYKDG
jgi:hypothetical protein